MITRIWHGYTTLSNADNYEKLLKQEVFASIEEKNILGYLGIQLLRRKIKDEVEFTTIMWFTNIESVKLFAGELFEKAYVPIKAQGILKHFDIDSIHCHVIHEIYYDHLGTVATH